MSRILDSVIGDERRADCERNDAAMRTFTRASLPYNTGKVLIGSAWTPPPPRMTADQERIQAAMGDPRTARPFPFWRRLIGAIWRWL